MLVKEEEIQKQCVSHFKQIYKAGLQKSPNDFIQISTDIRGEIEKIPMSAALTLDEIPTDQEIHWAVHAQVFMKALGPDGINNVPFKNYGVESYQYSSTQESEFNILNFIMQEFRRK